MNQCFWSTIIWHIQHLITTTIRKFAIPFRNSESVFRCGIISIWHQRFGKPTLLTNNNMNIQWPFRSPRRLNRKRTHSCWNNTTRNNGARQRQAMKNNSVRASKNKQRSMSQISNGKRTSKLTQLFKSTLSVSNRINNRDGAPPKLTRKS